MKVVVIVAKASHLSITVFHLYYLSNQQSYMTDFVLSPRDIYVLQTERDNRLFKMEFIGLIKI